MLVIIIIVQYIVYIIFLLTPNKFIREQATTEEPWGVWL